MHDFAWSFIGGILLGISVVGYLYTNGRIAGISGLVSQVLNLKGTSGHGICGISRLSKRSIIATMSFMFAGFITVYVVRHMLGAI